MEARLSGNVAAALPQTKRPRLVSLPGQGVVSCCGARMKARRSLLAAEWQGGVCVGDFEEAIVLGDALASCRRAGFQLPAARSNR